MYKVFPVSAAGLEVRAVVNPTVLCEGISSSPRPSWRLVLPFVFGNGIYSLLILIARGTCGGERSGDLDESGNLIRTDGPRTQRGGKRGWL